MNEKVLKKIAFVKHLKALIQKKVDTFIAFDIGNGKYEEAYPIIVDRSFKLIKCRIFG